MDRILIVVKSSFQLVSAVLIRQMYLECECTLLLDGELEFLRNMGSTKSINEAFDKVSYFREGVKKNNKIARCIDYFLNRNNDKLGSEDDDTLLKEKFDRIFYFSFTPNISTIFGNIQKKYPDTIFCKTEDGLASYVLAESEIDKNKKVFKNKIFHMFLEQPEKEELYLLFPELYVGEDCYNLRKVIISENAKHIFKDACDEILKEKCELNKYLVFEECFDQVSDEEAYIKVLQSVVEVLGKDSVSVKPHPRNTKRVVDGPSMNMGIPWEFFCLAYGDELKGKKLFSLISTTCYMPHLLGVEDVETYYLYPCYKGTIAARESKKFNEFMNKLNEKCPYIHVVSDLNDINKLF